MDDFEKGPLLDVVRAIFGYGLFSADREEWTVQQKAALRGLSNMQAG